MPLAVRYLLLLGMTTAQLPPLLNRELFFGDPQIANLEISPDGKWLAFLKPYNGTLNIWIQPIRDGELGEAFPITASNRRPITQYFWSPDSRFILYVQDKDGDENYHLYRITIAEAKPGTVPIATDLTPRPGIRVYPYAFPKFKPEIAYIGLNDRDPSLHDLYELHLPSGRLTLLYTNSENILGWEVDEEGRIRFATKVGPEGETQIYEVNRKGSAFSFRKVYEVAWDESAGIVYLPRKGSEVYLLTNRGVDKTRLVLFNPKTGVEKEIHKDPEDRVDIGSVLFDEKTDKLRLVSYTDDRRRRYFFDDKLRSWFQIWQERLPGGEVGLASLSEDERYAVVVFSSDREPARYYLWDAQRQQLREIARARPDLPSEHLAEMRPIRIRTRDGAEIPAYLTLPKGLTPKNLPAVLYVHGGPWARDYWGYDAMAQFLANRGYAVLQVNFRASTGYGKAFLNAGNKEWGTGRMQHDLTDAVQQMVREGLFDPKRIAIMGGSYGGYATLAGVTFTPDLYACGISIVGPSSIITLIRSVPPYWKPLIKTFYHRVGNPNDPQDLERLKAQSPLYHIERIRVPLLIVQGANDPRVKQQESDQIVAALHAKGYPVRYLLAPDEGHGFQNYDNRMAMIVAIEQFLSERLGGRLQAEVPEAIAKRLLEITKDPAQVRPPAPSDASAAKAKLELIVREPQLFRWNFTFRLQGKEISLQAVERWEALPTGWRFTRITEAPQLPMLSGKDTVEVDASGLLATYRRTQQGLTIAIQREGDRLHGTYELMGQPTKLDLLLGGKPVYPPNEAILYYLGALPLEQGYRATVELFSPLTQNFEEVEISVEREEKVTLGGQERVAWKVRLTQGNKQQEVWLDKATRWPLRLQVKGQGMELVGERAD
ncbi:MAG: S9 family peptidase [Bacteroidia bacterium]|nr:S9 family peptidase [Bacteroidia bacterium]MDW8089011.1 S9 family peptidase [Bacteroidia bacterium]